MTKARSALRRIVEFKNRLPRFLRNKYAITFMAFLAWVSFFDQNNAILRWQEYSGLQRDRARLHYLEEQTERVRAEQEALFSSQENLERFAREQYFMKRQGEDLFLVVD